MLLTYCSMYIQVMHQQHQCLSSCTEEHDPTFQTHAFHEAFTKILDLGSLANIRPANISTNEQCVEQALDLTRYGLLGCCIFFSPSPRGNAHAENVNAAENRHTATHCNTLQHTATHCNTLQHTAAHCQHCHTLQHTLPHTATHRNTLQHTAAHCISKTKHGRGFVPLVFFLVCVEKGA